MKLKLFIILTLILTVFSCSEDSDPDPGGLEGTSFDGLYVGTASSSNVQIATWVASVYNNQLIGVSTDEDGEVIFEGTVSDAGMVSGSFDLEVEGTVFTINISGNVADGTMSGTWEDALESGTWSGSLENSGFNGLYEGTASDDTGQVATWVAAVYDSQLLGVSTNESGEVIFEGTVTNAGAVTGSFDQLFDGITFTVNIMGNISGETMSGTWADSEDSGTWTGTRL